MAEQRKDRKEFVVWVDDCEVTANPMVREVKRKKKKRQMATIEDHVGSNLLPGSTHTV